MKQTKVDPQIFWPALLVILGISIPAAINPEAGGKVVNVIMAWITGKFGWLYLIFGLASFLLLIWLAAGRYGHVKLGGPDDKPEFSKFTWIAMLFCAGIGSSLIYWSIIEPIYYMQGPPYGIEAGSIAAAEWAATYGAFHWGFSAWAIYCLPAAPIAYAYYVRKQPQLRFSTATRSLLGKYTDGFVGKAIDVFVMFGIMGGVGTSLGLGTPMISACISKIFGIPESFGLNIIILLIWVCIFGTSVYLGLEKGIAKLSNINMYIAIALAAFVLVVGPTAFIFNTFTNSISLIFQNFWRMSLWTDPIAQGGFPQGWTIFYWAWWVAYAPMMGLFVARISKGRTIRELVVAECVWGTLGCWVYFAILGCYSINVELYGAQSMTQLMADQGPAMAIATILASLPLSKVVLPLFVILMFVFLATTLDSSAYMLASVSSKDLSGNAEPARWNRVLWASVLGVMAIGMFAIGGLSVIQASSIVLAFPCVFVMILLVWAFLKDLYEDYGASCAPSIPKVVEYLEGGIKKTNSNSISDSLSNVTNDSLNV